MRVTRKGKTKLRRFLCTFIAGLALFACAAPCFAAVGAPVGSAPLTQEEETYIKENPVVTIAMDVSWIPYAMYDKGSDAVIGIIPNILDMVCNRLGFRVEYMAKDTYADALAAVRSGETMLVSGVADDRAMTEKNHVLNTDPYITINYSAVTQTDVFDLYDAASSRRVAVCVGSYSTMAMREQMPTYEFVEYHSNEECMDAVVKGDVDTALIATYAAEYYKGLPRYENLRSILISNFSWGLCFGVNQESDPVLIEILNKGIATLTENDVNQAIYEGLVDAASRNRGFLKWVYDQPIAAMCVTGGMILLVLLLVVLLITRHNKNRQLEYERKLNAELTAANRAKQEFLSRMSHELRTPMNAIIGSAELSLKLPGRPEKMTEYLEQIQTAGKYLMGIIGDLLDADLMEKGVFELDLAWVSPTKPFCSAVSAIAAEFEEKGVFF
ncbi:MAG: transporter substrate-binding domain-containing protein [Oscillospiraceae bacterium]|nr:transporter substrate-binding domain-containing protein [Oscillospiraceae bacterium]